MLSPAEEFARVLLERAVMERAADIHLEPFERDFKIRLRTPAGLMSLPAPDKVLYPALLRHFKLMARLDIAQEALPQDGKFALEQGGAAVEFRLSCLPTVWGQSVMMRVLDRERTPLGMDSLGLGAAVVDELREALRLTHGLVVVAGPTGSGKTTTLYACLRELAAPGNKKILSVEDPIEYALSGVQQVGVSENISFAGALRSFLRHDPDVIFVGEIRDRETARLAVQAALTGHLVLTSVHTRTVEEVPLRLVDLGVEEYLITSALKCVLAQQMTTGANNTRVPVATGTWRTPAHA